MKLKRKHIALLVVIMISLVVMCFLNFHYKIYALNYDGNGRLNERHFSIMTFNVDATDPEKFTIAYQDSLIEMIRIEKPDILCFQELPYVNLLMLKSQLDSIFGYCSGTSGSDALHKQRVYSHLPFRNLSIYPCVGDFATENLNEEEEAEIEQFQKKMNLVSAEFEVEPGRWVTAFSGHLRSSAYSTARRSMDKGASWFDGISLYKRNYDVGKRIRDYEAENARRYVDDALQNGKPVVVAGDLNDWCGSDCLNTLMGDDLKDAWWEGGNGFGWTYFGWHLRLRLDHILYSDKLDLVDVKVVDTDLSDHKPLIARFRVK